MKSLTLKLENIDKNGPARWLPPACGPPPETPRESMEFLARSWSVSATELSKALANTSVGTGMTDASSTSGVVDDLNTVFMFDRLFLQPLQELCSRGSAPVSPRESEDLKELFQLHRAMNPELISNQQLLKNGTYKNVVRGQTTRRWLKQQKERKKQEIRAQNAQLHAAVSVAGVAASNPVVPETTTTCPETSIKGSTAMASAAALVASHCIEIAEDMGADHEQILTVVNSAMNARTNGDIMTLTAGAATGHSNRFVFVFNS